MERLKGKVAIVTGGGNGIGAAICQRLNAEGARVLVADVDIDAAKRVSAKLKSSIPWQVDVSDEAQVQGLIAQATKWAGGFSIYVNSAVRWIFGGVDTASDEDWTNALSVNVKGYALGIKHASLAMSQQAKTSTDDTEGKSQDDAWPCAILNIASVASFRAFKDMAPYVTTKGAIVQLTKSCALDLAKHKIRVNCICPGPISTEAIQKWLDSIGVTKEQAFDSIAPHLIIPRNGLPGEVAAAAAFLVSDDASYITGIALPVDGGFLAM